MSITMPESESSRTDKLEAARLWKKLNPGRHAELAREYRLRNPEKTKAHNKVSYALRKGKLTKLPCETCGSVVNVHAHHHDYSKPLDVRWLCFKCHKAEHPVGDEDKAVKFPNAKKAQLPGSLNPNAAFSDDDVRVIRVMLEQKHSQQRIAEYFGVSQHAISDIKLGRTYSKT